MQDHSQSSDEELKRRRGEVSSNLSENSLPLIQAQRVKFLELMEDDELKKSFLKVITDFYLNPDNLSGTFKNKIDKLLNNCFVNPDPSNLGQGSADDAQKKLELNKVCASLAKYDKGFIEKILPEASQLRPKVPFKGWGLRIRFEDDKIFIDDKEVKSVMNKAKDGGDDIIAKLRTDFPDNPIDFPDNIKLFQLGFIDFLRNTESAKLIYADSNTQPRPLEKSDKKTLICDDSLEGFKILPPSHGQTNADESKFLRARIDEYREIAKGLKATPLSPKVAGATTGPTREAPPPTEGCSSPLTWIIQRCGGSKMPSPAKPQSQEQKPGTAVSRRLGQAGTMAYRLGDAVFAVAIAGILRPGASGMPVL